MIHVSWVSPAWVLRAMSGSATFNDDIAETTAARAMHTTAVIARWLEGRPLGLARSLVFSRGAHLLRLLRYGVEF